MALIRALNSSISGLRSHQVRIDTIGNNLANVNTIAYKASRTMFQTQLSQTLSHGAGPSGTFGGVNPQQVGLGVNLGAISQDFTQGALDRTGIASDMAIQGDGFFIVEDGDGTPLYTRDGSFRRNVDNFLVNPATGYRVQGWQATFMTDTTIDDFPVDTGGPVGAISVPVGELAIAQATTSVNLVGNLNPDGDTAVNGTVTASAAFDDSLTGTSATAASLLTNLEDAASGSSLGLSNGDTITVTAKKGGRQLPSASFIVGTTGTTLGDFRDWLEDRLGVHTTSTASSSLFRPYGAERTDAAGAVDAVATVGSTVTITDSSEDFVTAGVTVGDVIRFNSGTAAGAVGVVTARTATTISFDTTAATDYSVPGVSGAAPTPAVADTFTVHRPTGVSVNASGQLEVVGNLGSLNRIESITTIDSSGSSLWSYTQSVAADGNSAHASYIVYDSLGAGHTVNFTMVEESVSDTITAWRYYADASDDTSGGLTVGHGFIAFDVDGQFSATTPLNNQFAIDLQAQGVTTQLIFSADFNGISQLSDGPSDVNLRSQDGFARGVLEAFEIGETGVITGIFSNGLKRSIAQVSLVRFSNNNGLISVGDNMYRVGTNSGNPQLGVAGTDGRGTLVGGALEESNVELSREFTDLIVTQRGFQANARVISVADEMLNELVNLRR